jgi:hypothetical protein
MSLGFIKWNRDGLCGAACAHMALRALIPGAIGPTTVDQESIWTSIKDHTHGSPKVPCCVPVPVPDQFAMMRGARPGDNCATCWWSYPTALRATLIEKLGKGTPVVVRRPADEIAATDIIRSCLDRSGVPIVLVDAGLHWVVVASWNANYAKSQIFRPRERQCDNGGCGPVERRTYGDRGHCGHL